MYDTLKGTKKLGNYTYPCEEAAWHAANPPPSEAVFYERWKASKEGRLTLMESELNSYPSLQDFMDYCNNQSDIPFEDFQHGSPVYKCPEVFYEHAEYLLDYLEEDLTIEELAWVTNSIALVKKYHELYTMGTEIKKVWDKKLELVETR
ncbi:MAG: hypothetical protein FWH12_02170 [Treponema sp.]|nr:hypothetical protein [Treponema sp.]